MIDKPFILIGVLGNNDIEAIRDEISYGIEEEGCLCSFYEMEQEKDIRFSVAEICITIMPGAVCLYVEEAKSEEALDMVSLDKAPLDEIKYKLRRLGCNAGRYLRNKPLKL